MARKSSDGPIVNGPCASIGLVEFESFPAGVYWVTKLAQTQKARQTKCERFAKKHRIGCSYAVHELITSDPKAVATILRQIRAAKAEFPFGAAKDMFELTPREFRTIAESVLEDHPASLLFSLRQSEFKQEELTAKIVDLESELACAKNECRKAATALNEKEIELDEAHDRMADLERELEEFQRRCDYYQDELEEANNKREELWERVQNLESGALNQVLHRY